MIVCIGSVLDHADLETVRADLDALEFRDGRATAGWAARGVKNNLQADGNDPRHARISQLLMQRLTAHEVFLAAALPRAFAPLLLSRYEASMSYGTHIDDAYMGSPPMRTDLSFTLFLSRPDDYVGGALVLERHDGDHEYRLDAGSLVLYPATLLHHVEAVASGTRSVAVGWIQSLCADPRMREILFDLSRVRKSLFEREGGSEAVNLLNKSYSNLLRLASG